MTYPDLLPQFSSWIDKVRGRLVSNQLLREITWFRVGGPAQLFFMPADEEDLQYFLQNLPEDIKITVIGLGSNLLFRDGGIDGVVIRLGAKGFGTIEPGDDFTITSGTAVPDVKLATAAGKAGIDGLTFYRGIPGGLGGALYMNAGCYGTETKDRMISLRGVNRAGEIVELSNDDMGYKYRKNNGPRGVIFTQATYQGYEGDPEVLRQQMIEITERRESTQPVKSRTGGSTFKNPEGHSSWKLVDEAGCRGLIVGKAEVSELHCNFLINLGDATAHDIETLGETVRGRVRETCGIDLVWEIRRMGHFLDNNSVKEFMTDEVFTGQV